MGSPFERALYGSSSRGRWATIVSSTFRIIDPVCLEPGMRTRVLYGWRMPPMASEFCLSRVSFGVGSGVPVRGVSLATVKFFARF